MNRPLVLPQPAQLAELVPMLRRAVGLDRSSLARLRVRSGRASVLLRLPFDVLVSRTVVIEPDPETSADADVTVRAADLVAWLDGDAATPPEPRDAEWRGGSPPERGWRRVETVPDDVVRGLVQRGARALDAATAGAQPRPEVVDALLDSVVITATADDHGAHAEVPLRAISALTRMGFLPGGSHVAIDVAGRWTRVAAPYGSVYIERPGSTLSLR